MYHEYASGWNRGTVTGTNAPGPNARSAKVQTASERRAVIDSGLVGCTDQKMSKSLSTLRPDGSYPESYITKYTTYTKKNLEDTDDLCLNAKTGLWP